MKKRIDIEKLLKWTYCEELPKGGSGKGGRGAASPWAMVESFMQLLTKVDDNEYGVVPTLNPTEGEPHPDALAVYAAVNALDTLSLDLPDGWNPIPEIDGQGVETDRVLAAARFGIVHARRSPSQIVQKHAILGGSPDWQGEIPKVKPVCNADGQPIWFMMRVNSTLSEGGNAVEFKSETPDGWNRNTKAPKAGAYQKFRFDPDPTPVIIARGEYQIWCSCLSVLVEELAEKLEKWEVTGPARAACPWEGDAMPEARILRDLKFSG